MYQERISELIQLAKKDQSEIFSQLLSALEHQEKSIVIGASLVLGRIGDQRAVPSLIRAFLTTDQEVGAAVAWALGRCNDHMATPFLSKAIESGFAVANSCEALGSLGDESAVPLLYRALSSSDKNVRACAAKGLGSVAVRCEPRTKHQIIERLEPLFHDSSRKVRICAAIILNRISSDAR